MKVEVKPHDPNWAAQFQVIKTSLESILEETCYVSIEHVGSTSVPGLAAKPIIDIDIIATADQLDAISSALCSAEAGYVYKGEMDIPQRYVFHYHPSPSSSRYSAEEAAIKRNLYVCIDGCVSLRNHLAVRDVCRRDQRLRDRYGRLKLELAQREFVDVDEYSEAKSEVLAEILRVAGLEEEEISGIRDVNVYPLRKS